MITLANAGSAGRLITALLQGRAHESATTLLLTGGAIWLTNVIVFGMWYWNLDRGGPAARAQALKSFPDFLFPQMTAPDLSPADWQPQFFDYLYLSFTNAAAFSPTDTLPLGTLGEDGDDDAVDRVTRHCRAGRRPRREHLEVIA